MASFKVGSKDVEFVPMEDMTLDELAYVKALSRMAPLEAQRAAFDGDPDVWRAMLAVAARRVISEIDDTVIDRLVGKLKLYEVIDAVYPDAEQPAVEETSGDPPAAAVETAPDPSGNGSSTAKIPEISGSR